MKRTAVYTVIFGGYDSLLTPVRRSDNCDYFCFTDDPGLTSEFWQIRLLQDPALEAARLSRKPKILPHLYFPEHEDSLYLDANLLLVGDIDTYIETYCRTSPILLVKHGERDCIYEELQACIEGQRDDAEVMTTQIERYRAEGFPAHYGLTVGSFIYRRHQDPAVIALMELWWQELSQSSKRDQLSLTYCLWRQKVNPDLYYGNNWNNDYFIWVPHHIVDNLYIDRLAQHVPSLAQDTVRLQSASFRSLDRRGQMPAKVYLDLGEGLAESQVIFVPPTVEYGLNHYVFNLPKGTRSLRFDPVEGDFCLVSEVQTLTDQRQRLLKMTNGRSLGGVDVFATTDPMYQLDNCEGVAQVEISLRLTVLTDSLHRRLLKAL
jgi:hypothetical protein